MRAFVRVRRGPQPWAWSQKWAEMRVREWHNYKCLPEGTTSVMSSQSISRGEVF